MSVFTLTAKTVGSSDGIDTRLAVKKMLDGSEQFGFVRQLRDGGWEYLDRKGSWRNAGSSYNAALWDCHYTSCICSPEEGEPDCQAHDANVAIEVRKDLNAGIDIAALVEASGGCYIG